jgi:ketol-acid reductoisomerase
VEKGWMMPTVFCDKDADLKYLEEKIVSVIGYGNQGRAQAMNLRDAGVELVIGCEPDKYRDVALNDGHKVMDIDDAVRASSIVMLLIPDEFQTALYRRSIAPHLKSGMTLSFGSGYNIRFKLIVPPKDIDVIMLAPRTIGWMVRETYVAGSGVAADADVWQDATGNAWKTLLALAKGIGCTRAGIFKTSFAEETELDLFSEQAVWPAIFDCILTAYELLVEKGYSREAVVLELYGSGEPSDIFRAMAQHGIFEQMRAHSTTSQYGVLSRRKGAAGADLRNRMENVLEAIRDGSFAREWAAEAEAKYSVLEGLRREAKGHPINEADRRVRQLLGCCSESTGDP